MSTKSKSKPNLIVILAVVAAFILAGVLLFVLTRNSNETDTQPEANLGAVITVETGDFKPLNGDSVYASVNVHNNSDDPVAIWCTYTVNSQHAGVGDANNHYVAQPGDNKFEEVYQAGHIILAEDIFEEFDSYNLNVECNPVIQDEDPEEEIDETTEDIAELQTDDEASEDDFVVNPESGSHIKVTLLPSNWDELTATEKTALDPYSCGRGYIDDFIIRSDNGHCVIKGTSINYLRIDSYGPQSYTPELLEVFLRGVLLAVPDDTTKESMDKVFEHFQAGVGRKHPSGAFPKVGSPLEAIGFRLSIYHYSDFEFSAQGYRSTINEHASPVRSYEIRPKHPFGVFHYGGYSTGERPPAAQVLEDGRDGSLPEGCEAAVDIILLYDYEFEHRPGYNRWSLGENESINLVYRYGVDNPSRSDFEAVFIDDQGAMQPDMREALLRVAGGWGLGEQGEKYDIQIKFYRYNEDKRFEFNRYDKSDIFEVLPSISVVECDS